jgi:hypothetical protein
VSGGDAFDNFSGVVRPAVVKRAVTDDVANNTAAAKHKVDRGVSVNPDAKPLEERIIEGCDLQVVLGPGNGDVRRRIVGARRERHRVPNRHADNHVATPGVQRAAQEAAPLRPPRVGMGNTQFRRHQGSDAVFEAFLLPIRKRQVIRVRANVQGL